MTENCLFCQQYYFDPGEPGYSELTPGVDTSYGCKKEIWDDDSTDTEEDYFRNMRTAETCEFFKPREKNNG